MSIHPNVMLMMHLSPLDLPRKTFLEIVDDPDDPMVKIGDREYHALLMDGDYHEGYQVSGAGGEIVLMDMVTYGYGERIAWDDLRAAHNALAAWHEANAERYRLSDVTRISVGANYW